MKTIKLYLLLICLGWSLIGCGKLKIENLTGKDQIESSPTTPIVNPVAFSNPAGKLSEVAPPETIQKLAQISDHLPKVEFLAPQSDRILPDANVEVKLRVRDLALFRDENLGLGPHLNLILDNRPARQIYNLEEPIILENLAPGTHTLRAFAVQPWNESYKNQEAFARTTFHILTKTDNNNPDPNRPLLTYNSPEGKYGAEPILLDFYLTNAPLHVIARENSDDEIEDWRIRVTINGESFILEEWQPIYLKGFEAGNNWVQIELLDELGNNLENAFNNTVKLVTYEPQFQDNLAKLVTGKISVAAARPIVAPNTKFETQPVAIPKTVEPEVRENETAIEEAEPAIAPEASQPVEAEELKASQATEVTPTSQTSEEIESIEIEPEASNVEIIEIKENLEAEKPQAEIERVDRAKETSKAETDSNLTSIEIIEIEEDLETEKPQAKIKLPATNSIEIVETDRTIELSESETASEPKLKMPHWFKNLWRNLRQKIAGITQRLANRD